MRAALAGLAPHCGRFENLVDFMAFLYRDGSLTRDAIVDPPQTVKNGESPSRSHVTAWHSKETKDGQR
jgi:hypothetical protein